MATYTELLRQKRQQKLGVSNASLSGNGGNLTAEQLQLIQQIQASSQQNQQGVGQTTSFVPQMSTTEEIDARLQQQKLKNEIQGKKEDTSKLNWWEKTVLAVNDFSNAVAKPIFSTFEGALDGLVTFGANLGKSVGLDTKALEDFIAHDYSQDLMNIRDKGNIVNPLAWTLGDNARKQLTDGSSSEILPPIVEQLGSGLGSGLGFASMGAIAKGANLGKVGTSVLNNATTFLSSGGMGVQESLQEGKDFSSATQYGVLSGATELALENVTGKVMNLVGKGLSKVGGSLGKGASKLLKSDANWNGVVRSGKQSLSSIFANMNEEGIEEVLSDLIDPINRMLTIDKDVEGNTIAEKYQNLFNENGGVEGLFLDYLGGAFSAGALGVGNTLPSLKHYGMRGTSLIQNTNEMVEINERIKEAYEKNQTDKIAKLEAQREKVKEEVANDFKDYLDYAQEVDTQLKSKVEESTKNGMSYIDAYTKAFNELDNKTKRKVNTYNYYVRQANPTQADFKNAIIQDISDKLGVSTKVDDEIDSSYYLSGEANTIVLSDKQASWDKILNVFGHEFGHSVENSEIRDTLLSQLDEASLNTLVDKYAQDPQYQKYARESLKTQKLFEKRTEGITDKAQRTAIWNECVLEYYKDEVFADLLAEEFSKFDSINDFKKEINKLSTNKVKTLYNRFVDALKGKNKKNYSKFRQILQDAINTPNRDKNIVEKRYARDTWVEKVKQKKFNVDAYLKDENIDTLSKYLDDYIKNSKSPYAITGRAFQSKIDREFKRVLTEKNGILDEAQKSSYYITKSNVESLKKKFVTYALNVISAKKEYLDIDYRKAIDYAIGKLNEEITNRGKAGAIEGLSDSQLEQIAENLKKARESEVNEIFDLNNIFLTDDMTRREEEFRNRALSFFDINLNTITLEELKQKFGNVLTFSQNTKGEWVVTEKGQEKAPKKVSKKEEVKPTPIEEKPVEEPKIEPKQEVNEAVEENVNEKTDIEKEVNDTQQEEKNNPLVSQGEIKPAVKEKGEIVEKNNNSIIEVQEVNNEESSKKKVEKTKLIEKENVETKRELHKLSNNFVKLHSDYKGTFKVDNNSRKYLEEMVSKVLGKKFKMSDSAWVKVADKLTNGELDTTADEIINSFKEIEGFIDSENTLYDELSSLNISQNDTHEFLVDAIEELLKGSDLSKIVKLQNAFSEKLNQSKEKSNIDYLTYNIKVTAKNISDKGNKYRFNAMTEDNVGQTCKNFYVGLEKVTNRKKLKKVEVSNDGKVFDNLEEAKNAPSKEVITKNENYDINNPEEVIQFIDDFIDPILKLEKSITEQTGVEDKELITYLKGYIETLKNPENKDSYTAQELKIFKALIQGLDHYIKEASGTKKILINGKMVELKDLASQLEIEKTHLDSKKREKFGNKKFFGKMSWVMKQFAEPRIIINYLGGMQGEKSVIYNSFYTGGFEYARKTYQDYYLQLTLLKEDLISTSEDKKAYDKLKNGNDKVKIDFLLDEDGKPAEFTKAQLIQLLGNIRDEQGKKAFIKGFRIGNQKILTPAEQTTLLNTLKELELDLRLKNSEYTKEEKEQKKKEIEKLKKNISGEQEKFIKMVDDKIVDILGIGKGTFEDRYYNYALKQFELIKQWKKKADTDMYGFSNVVEDSYWTVRSDVHRTNTSLNKDTKTDNIVEINPGYNLERKNPTVLDIDNVTDVIDAYQNSMLRYCAYAPTAKAIQRMLTYKNETSRKSLRMYIADSYDSGNSKSAHKNKDHTNDLWDYIVDLTADMQRLQPAQNQTERQWNKVLGFVKKNFAVFQLGMNIKVALTQTASLGAATKYINAKYLAKGFAISNDLKSIEDPMLLTYRAKSNEIVDAETFGLGAKIQNWSTKLISKMDAITIRKIWQASLAQMQAKYGIKYSEMSEVQKLEFVQEATKLFEKTVNETQPNYDALQRSAFMRSNRHPIIQLFTMFRTQQGKMFSNLLEGYYMIKAHKEYGTPINKKLLVGIGESILLNGVIYSLMSYLINKILNGDWDEEPKTVIGELGVDTFNNTLLGIIPIVSSFVKLEYDKEKGFAFAYDEMNSSYLDAVWSIFANVSEFKESSPKQIVDTIGQFTGMPTRNLYKLIRGVAQYILPDFTFEVDRVYNDNKATKSNVSYFLSEGKTSQARVYFNTFNKNSTNQMRPNVSTEMFRLYKEGYTSASLKQIPTTITQNEIEYTIDSNAFKNVYQSGVDLLSSLIEKNAYKSLNDDDKAYTIGKISTLYYSIAKKTQIGNKLNNLEKSVSSGYKLEMKDLMALKGIEELNGTKEDVVKYINKLVGTRQYKYFIYFLSGYKLTEQQEKLVSGYLRQKGVNNRKIKLLFSA